MFSGGLGLRRGAQTRRSVVFFWTALFVMSIGLQYLVATTPAPVIAASGLKAGTVAGFEVDGDLASGNAASNPGHIPAGLFSGLINAQDWLDGNGVQGAVDPADPPQSFIFRDAVDSASVPGDVSPDTSAYVGGNKEVDTRPWDYFNNAGPNDKTDYRHVMAAVKKDGSGNPFVFLGAERISTNGSMVVDFELNQKPFKTWADGVAKPDRSIDDILISLEYANGGSNPEVTLYRVSAITTTSTTGQVVTFSPISDATTVAAVRSATNFVDLVDVAFPTATYTVPAFAWAEASVNLNALNLPASCLTFGQGSIRSRTGGSPSTSQLKDASKSFPLSINTCAKIAIEKVDKHGDHIGGASFTITPNPLVGAPAGSTLTITDNDAHDSDPRDGYILIGPCEPQVKYTVTETSAPEGYIKDPDPQSKTAVPGDTVTFTFVNGLGSIAWQKNGPDGTSLLGGATFTITPNPKTGSGTLTVADNGANDADDAAGRFKVTGVRVDRAGGYTIAETVPPDGYIGSSATANANPTSAAPNVTIAAGTWVNTLGSFTWVKNGPDGTSLLGGATFTITPNPLTGAAAPLTVVDNDANDADKDPGEFQILNARTGTYAVQESVAPDGYIIDPDPANVTVSATAQHPSIEAGTFVNNLGRIRWLKVGPDESTLLGGATFRVTPNPVTGAGSLDVVDNTGQPGYTGADKDATAGEFELRDVPVGTYSIVEITAPSGYILDSTPLTAEITSPMAAPYTAEAGSVTNRLASLSWVKRDGHGALLGGATFTVTGTAGAAVGFAEDVLDNTGQAGYAGLDTDPAAGQFTITGLKLGTYSVVEKTAPAGYIKDTNARSVEVTGPTATISIPFVNTLGSLAWVKHDGNGALLGGATFLVTGPFGYSESVTDNTGLDADPTAGEFLLVDLKLGTYTVTETTAPAGYVKDTTPQSALVDGPGASIELPFVNTLGSLAWVKHDDKGNLLGGATFLVTGPFGYSESVTDNAGLDADPTAGELLLQGLKLGTYTISETAAPAGYIASTVHLQGTLTQEAPDATVAVAFVNSLGEISWTKDKGDEAETPLGGATFSVSPNPFTGVGALTVVDNDANDADARDGFFRLVDVPTGTYTIAETAAPEGYSKDPATCDVTVDAETPAGDTTCSFSNPPIPPEIDVVKTAGASAGSQAADGATYQTEVFSNNVTYKYVVTNTGDVRLTNVTVVDDNGTPANPADDFEAACEAPGVVQPFELAAHASVTCFMTRSITQATTNTVTAAGQSVGEGTPVSATDDAVVTIIGPAITIIKTAGASAGSQAANGATYATEAFADNVTYVYVVKNTGTTTLNAVALTDNKLGPISCPKDTLAPNEEMTCTATATVAADTINVATASGTSPAGKPVSANDAAEVVILTPSISIVKTAGNAADGEPFFTDGGDVTYTYVVTNTGQVDLTDVVVVDDRGTASPADDVTVSLCTKGGQAVSAPFSLAAAKSGGDGPDVPAESMTCTATIPVNVDTTNVATASGDTPHATVTDKDDAVVLVSRVSISKTNDAEGTLQPGDTVSYEIALDVVNGPIASMTVVDLLPANFGTPSGISDGGVYAAAARTITWHLANVADGKTLTYDVAIALSTQGGDYVNTATITEGPCFASCDDDSTVPVWRMSILKANDAESPQMTGDVVAYTLTLAVQNGPIDSVTVVDQLPADFGTPSSISDGGVYAAAARTITWNLANVADGTTLTYDVTIGAATVPGDYVNVATITHGPCVAGDCDDDSTVPVVAPDPAKLVVVKLLDVDGDLATTDDRFLAPDWTFITAISGGTISATTGTTGADGTVTFGVDVAANGVTALVDVTETFPNPTDFKLLDASCAMGDEGRGTLSSMTVGDVAVNQGETVTCTFINTSGEVEEATATPKVTPPPTDMESIPASDSSGNVLLVLLAIVGLVAVLGILTPAPARARRRNRRG